MYECHITILETNDTKVDYIENTLLKDCDWKFSKIDGDPILGKGIKCYATKHFSTKTNINLIIKHMNDFAEWLKNSGALVIREKVELIIYDTKKK